MRGSPAAHTAVYPPRDAALTPASARSSWLHAPALVHGASPALSRPHAPSWRHSGFEADSVALQQENEQLRHHVHRLQEQVSNATMRESLIDSLQQRLVQTRHERDKEVRESDALFSQLQEHMSAKQEIDELRSMLCEVLSQARTATNANSNQAGEEQAQAITGVASGTTQQLVQELRCVVADLVQSGQVGAHSQGHDVHRKGTPQLHAPTQPPAQPEAPVELQPAADLDQRPKTQRRLDWSRCPEPSVAHSHAAVQCEGTEQQASMPALQPSCGSAEVCSLTSREAGQAATPHRKVQSEGGLSSLLQQQSSATDGQQEQLLQRARELESHAEQLASLLHSAMVLQPALDDAKPQDLREGGEVCAAASCLSAEKLTEQGVCETGDDVISPSDQGDSAWVQQGIEKAALEAPGICCIPQLQCLGDHSSAAIQGQVGLDAAHPMHASHQGRGHAEPCTPLGAEASDPQPALFTGAEGPAPGTATTTEPLHAEVELERLKQHNAQLRLDAFVSRAQLRIARLLPGSSHCTPATPASTRLARATLSPRAVTMAGLGHRRTCSPPLRPRVLRMGIAGSPAAAAAVAAAAVSPRAGVSGSLVTPEARSILRMEDDRVRVGSVLQRVHEQRARLKAQVLQLHHRLRELDKENKELRQQLGGSAPEAAETGAEVAAGDDAAGAKPAVGAAAAGASVVGGSQEAAATATSASRMGGAAEPLMEQQGAGMEVAKDRAKGDEQPCAVVAATADCESEDESMAAEAGGVADPLVEEQHEHFCEGLSEASAAAAVEQDSIVTELQGQVAGLAAKLQEYQGYLAEAQEEIAKLQDEVVSLRQGPGKAAGSSPGSGLGEQEKEEFMRGKVLEIQDVVRCIMQEKERLQGAHRQQLQQVTHALQQSESEKTDLVRKVMDLQRQLEAMGATGRSLQHNGATLGGGFTAVTSPPSRFSSRVTTPRAHGSDPPPAGQGTQHVGAVPLQLTPNPLFEPGASTGATPGGKSAMPVPLATTAVSSLTGDTLFTPPVSATHEAHLNNSSPATNSSSWSLPVPNTSQSRGTPDTAASSLSGHAAVAQSVAASSQFATPSASSAGNNHNLSEMSDQQVLAYSNALKQRILGDLTGLSQQLSMLTQTQQVVQQVSEASCSTQGGRAVAALPSLAASGAGQEGASGDVAAAFGELERTLRFLAPATAASSFADTLLKSSTSPLMGSCESAVAMAPMCMQVTQLAQLPPTLQRFAPPSLRAGLGTKHPFS